MGWTSGFRVGASPAVPENTATTRARFIPISIRLLMAAAPASASRCWVASVSCLPASMTSGVGLDSAPRCRASAARPQRRLGLPDPLAGPPQRGADPAGRSARGDQGVEQLLDAPGDVLRHLERAHHHGHAPTRPATRPRSGTPACWRPAGTAPRWRRSRRPRPGSAPGPCRPRPRWPGSAGTAGRPARRPRSAPAPGRRPPGGSPRPPRRPSRARPPPGSRTPPRAAHRPPGPSAGPARARRRGRRPARPAARAGTRRARASQPRPACSSASNGCSTAPRVSRPAPAAAKPTW